MSWDERFKKSREGELKFHEFKHGLEVLVQALGRRVQLSGYQPTGEIDTEPKTIPKNPPQGR